MRNGIVLWCAAACLCALAVFCSVGCGDDDNRVPTKAEGQAADVKRQAYIDSMPNLTPEQKAMMKSHLGGPPVQSPMDAAKSKAGAAAGATSGR